MINFKLPKWLKATEASALRIGIEGLSQLASEMELGGQYFVSVDTEQARQALICSTARSAMSGGSRCVIVSPDPQKLSEMLHFSDRAAGQQHNKSSLLLLSQLPNIAVHLQSHGCERFLQELEELGVCSGALLILEAADDFFIWQDAKQVNVQAQRFREWLKAVQVAGLFLLTPQSSQQIHKDFARQLELSSGFAEFHKDLGCYRWLIKHWYSAHGALEDSDHEVHLSGSDCELKVVEFDLDSDASGDETLVYYTADSIDKDESVPEDWVLCQSYQDALAVGAPLDHSTVILDYRQQSSFPQLAQTVHHLRYIAGRHMRIVIRERGGQLRYSQELLLTRLGATQIVYMEFSFSRLLRAVEASSGLRFTGQIDEDFDHALAAAMPSEECGYLPAGRFCEVVKSTLQKTEAIEMHHVLVRLDILPQLAHVDVLLNCQPRRANDVVTADESHVYIFLFACREADIDSALSRIIIEPLEQMFTGESYWSGHRNILNVLDSLHERYKLTGMADFSLVLPATRHQVAAEPTSIPTSSITAKSRVLPDPANAHAEVSSVVHAPRSVVRHPLKLRS
jgi:cellulose biosynthesis protein BcsE